MNYLEFLVGVASGFEAQGKRYAWLGRYLLAMGSKRIAAYVEAGREAVEKPAKEPDFYDEGWIYVDGEKELYVTRCAPLLCIRTRYVEIAEGSPRDVYRLLAEKEGWPVGSEESLVAEAMPLAKVPPPDPLFLQMAVWAAAMGRRTWVARSPTDIAIVTKGEKWVVRERIVIDKSTGYRLRRYVYEVAEVEYVARDGRNAYIIERGEAAYILGGYKALRYDRAIKEMDISEVPVEALRKVSDRAEASGLITRAFSDICRRRCGYYLMEAAIGLEMASRRFSWRSSP